MPISLIFLNLLLIYNLTLIVSPSSMLTTRARSHDCSVSAAKDCVGIRRINKSTNGTPTFLIFQDTEYKFEI
jgi:hypothetical protein